MQRAQVSLILRMKNFISSNEVSGLEAILNIF